MSKPKVQRSCLFATVTAGTKTLIAKGRRGLMTNIYPFVVHNNSGVAAIVNIYLDEELIETKSVGVGASATFTQATNKVLTNDQRLYFTSNQAAVSGIGTIRQTLERKC